MLTPLLGIFLAASPVTVRGASAEWDGKRLFASVRTDAPLAADAAHVELHGHRLLIGLRGAALDATARVFHDSAVPVKARWNDNEVELELPIASRLECGGPSRVDVVGDGLRVSLGCALHGTPAAEELRGLVSATPAATEAVPSAPSLKSSPTAPAPAPSPSVPVPAPAAQLDAVPPAAPAARPRAEPLGPAAPAHAEAPAATSSLTTTAAPALVLLALAGVAIWASRRRSSAPRLVQVLETASMGPKRALIVARMGQDVLLLGSSENGISLLATRPASEALPKVPEAAEPESAESAASQLFAQLWPKKEKTAFDALLGESVEDQELRAKLQAGLAGRVS